MLTLNRASTMGLVLAHGLVAMLLVWPAHAQKPDSAAGPRMPSGFAAGADALLARHYPQDAPGAVAIVVKDGRPVFRRAYGLADLEFGILLEPDMVLRIGSVTKQFTAAAILQLVDAGKLALDDDLSKYVDGYDTGGRRVTIEHLLTHTSGIPNYTDMDEWARHLPEELTPRQILDMVKAEAAGVRSRRAVQVQQLRLPAAWPRHREGGGPFIRRLYPPDGASARHAANDVRRHGACDPASRARV